MAKLIDLNGLAHVYSIIKGMLADKLGKNDTAAAATRDGAGNNIVDTYAKKTDITPIRLGGTGATTASTALNNLGGVPTSEVANSANKIPRYNSSGHLVLPDGSEFWIA